MSSRKKNYSIESNNSQNKNKNENNHIFDENGFSITNDTYRIESYFYVWVENELDEVNKKLSLLQKEVKRKKKKY